MKKLLITMLLLLLTACSNTNPAQTTKSTVTEPMHTSGKPSHTIKKPENLINANGQMVQERIRVPKGFERINVENNSFGQYLRDLPVKPDGTKIMLYNGDVTEKNVHVAVLDIDVGNRDLQQCADAVIRLRAEYLYSQGLYKRIHFNFTNGFNADYWKWINGNRIVVKGTSTYWVNNANYSKEYSSFRKYLDVVFAYAGTLSLSNEMKNEPIENMQIGDVFLKGATPGHAVIVLDMAENEKTGEKIFLTAQSYMPAQSIHILKNPENETLSPWYSTNFGDTLKTPEWDFDKSQLMRFEN
ncbi:DUF4846 domain-containing protein [Ruminiclostridium papyrosolvens]|uniref:DUF4846 domain-containing protein n=1 Tax=Ruminiclostridium papyrosolvens C7 TaxID=1330534 RepID=U4R768_9FIRM|nr:DUF4846 domain-containing protein [Ruminiclostridium papyrosolvens]EPR14278.1 hypothetical protein L323_00305 [Ruminiclostridium papyrosolvens C7]